MPTQRAPGTRFRSFPVASRARHLRLGYACAEKIPRESAMLKDCIRAQSFRYCCAARRFRRVARRRADLHPHHPPDRAVPAGGSNDVMARIIAPHLEQALGQTVIVDNRPAAAGISRQRRGGEGAAGWPHAAAGRILAHGDAGGEFEAALQHREGFRAALAYQHQRDGVLRQSEGAGEDAQGVHRAGEERSRQVQLFVAGRRQPDPSHGRTLEQARRHQDAAHPLQGRCAGDDGGDIGRGPVHHAGAERDLSAYRGRHHPSDRERRR